MGSLWPWEDRRMIPIHKVVDAIGPDKANALPFFPCF